jgi:hypothetical protein
MIEQPAIVTPIPDVPPGYSIAVTLDLNPFALRRPCRADGEDIIVCGRRGESPYRTVEPPPVALDPVRETHIPFGLDVGQGMRLGPTIDQVTLPGGFISQRVMMTLRTRF